MTGVFPARRTSTPGRVIDRWWPCAGGPRFDDSGTCKASARTSCRQELLPSRWLGGRKSCFACAVGRLHIRVREARGRIAAPARGRCRHAFASTRQDGRGVFTWPDNRQFDGQWKAPRASAPVRGAPGMSLGREGARRTQPGQGVLLGGVVGTADGASARVCGRGVGVAKGRLCLTLHNVASLGYA